ncbi:hypothetical protein SISSUDRAFT_1065745 [Sistotremastrum suecicum HHB10207 ss-3]|uniref:CBM1 domain-containing protein n=1 Tax=Sistotremastrum suecicum HHB10207 ss-3 TaxID=1314776 RepID=A0A165Z4J1_9AGAM|nr:hypothetical protein SISSUDRAFT_1065745 [Sistotremastrum suecicum HHB10207 ss-3]
MHLFKFLAIPFALISVVSAAGSTITTTTAPPGPTQTKYGQCGGIEYYGPTECAPGLYCSLANAYYSECL